jgi:hypothetical protein
MGTVFGVLLRCDRCDGAGDVVQTIGADGDPDDDLVPGTVIADLELEGVVQTALEVLGQAGIGRARVGLVSGEPGAPST